MHGAVSRPACVWAQALVLRTSGVKLERQVSEGTGFAWDRAKFLPGSLYGAMFWMRAENSVGNTGDV